MGVGQDDLMSRLPQFCLTLDTSAVVSYKAWYKLRGGSRCEMSVPIARPSDTVRLIECQPMFHTIAKMGIAYIGVVNKIFDDPR